MRFKTQVGYTQEFRSQHEQMLADQEAEREQWKRENEAARKRRLAAEAKVKAEAEAKRKAADEAQQKAYENDLKQRLRLSFAGTDAEFEKVAPDMVRTYMADEAIRADDEARAAMRRRYANHF
jgi:membrane protein involved in colicin uptake